jgi:hypothetical protein
MSIERLIFKGERFPDTNGEDSRTQVIAECMLDVPLNTVQNPKEICIHKIVVRPVWMEAADLWFRYENTNEPAEEALFVHFRPVQNVRLDKVAIQISTAIAENFPGNAKTAKVRATSKVKGEDNLLLLHVQPGVSLYFSKQMQKFFSISAGYENRTNTISTLELLVSSFSRDVFYDTYTLNSAEVRPVYVLNKRRERTCAVFHLHNIESVDEIADYDYQDGDYIPLDDMLHQEKLTFYISRLSQPHVPIVASHYQILVIVSIRDRDIKDETIQFQRSS